MSALQRYSPLRSSPFICGEIFGFTVWPWHCLLLPATVPVLNPINGQTNKISPAAAADTAPVYLNDITNHQPVPSAILYGTGEKTPGMLIAYHRWPQRVLASPRADGRRRRGRGGVGGRTGPAANGRRRCRHGFHLQPGGDQDTGRPPASGRRLAPLPGLSRYSSLTRCHRGSALRGTITRRGYVTNSGRIRQVLCLHNTTCRL